MSTFTVKAFNVQPSVHVMKQIDMQKREHRQVLQSSSKQDRDGAFTEETMPTPKPMSFLDSNVELAPLNWRDLEFHVTSLV